MAEARVRANAAFADGRYEEALEAFTSLLCVEADSALLLCNRSATLMKLSRFSEAVADATHAVELSPNTIKPAYRLACALHARSNHREALLALEPALVKQPSNSQLLSLRDRCRAAAAEGAQPPQPESTQPLRLASETPVRTTEHVHTVGSDVRVVSRRRRSTPPPTPSAAPRAPHETSTSSLSSSAARAGSSSQPCSRSGAALLRPMEVMQRWWGGLPNPWGWHALRRGAQQVLWHLDHWLPGLAVMASRWLPMLSTQAAAATMGRPLPEAATAAACTPLALDEVAELPCDLLCAVLQQLGAFDLVHAKCVCRRWADATRQVLPTRGKLAAATYKFTATRRLRHPRGIWEDDLVNVVSAGTLTLEVAREPDAPKHASARGGGHDPHGGGQHSGHCDGSAVRSGSPIDLAGWPGLVRGQVEEMHVRGAGNELLRGPTASCGAAQSHCVGGMWHPHGALSFAFGAQVSTTRIADVEVSVSSEGWPFQLVVTRTDVCAAWQRWQLSGSASPGVRRRSGRVDGGGNAAGGGQAHAEGSAQPGAEEGTGALGAMRLELELLYRDDL